MTELSVVRLEHFTPELIQQLCEIENDAFGLDGALNKWSFPVYIRHGAVFLLYSDNRIFGIADIMRDFNEPELAFLYNFVIKRDERRKGLAYYFLQTIKKRLEKEGIRRIQLTVAPGNTAAIRLYRKVGFEKIAELVLEYGAGNNRYLYELRMEEVYGRER